MPVAKNIEQISIHALRVEGDLTLTDEDILEILFLSTPSGWRATRTTTASSYISNDFYPRPPGGGRRKV